MPRVRPIYDPAVMQNRSAREVIRNRAIEVQIPLETQAFPASQNMTGQAVVFVPENVGLLKGFWVEIAATVTNTGTLPLTSAFIGPLALISNVSFTDAKGITRVNAPLYAIHFLNSVKNNFPLTHTFKAAAIDTPVNYGSNSIVVNPVIALNTLWQQTGTPSGSFNQVQITNGQTSQHRVTFWVPLAYSDTDYRGAIYAGTLNTQMSLQITINPAAFLNYTGASGIDGLSYLFAGAGAGTVAGTITNFTVAVTQVSMDQLPVDPETKQPVLPLQDLATVYELQLRSYSGMGAAGVDFKFPLPDYREVLGVLLANSNTGVPVPAYFKYFGLKAASSTYFRKWSASLLMALTRLRIHTDLPSTNVWFDFRSAPVSNTRYGSLAIVVNLASASNATLPIYQFLESFVPVAQLINAN